MEDFNFMGGGFDQSEYEQTSNELLTNNLHIPSCLTPWEPPESCIECFARSASDSNQSPASEMYEAQQYTSAMPVKTYAEAAAWSPDQDTAQEPLIESMPVRRPRIVSAGEAARMAMHSQYLEQWTPPQRQRQVLHVNDILMDINSPIPMARRQGPTYAEVAQHPYEHAEFFDEGVGSYCLFTSTENSMGLPNQSICRIPHQSPDRVPRTPGSHMAPHPVTDDRRQVTLPQDVYIPTLTQPEHNLNPRDPYTLVQRTGRGGHREHVTSTSGSNGASSALSTGTPSTASATSRSLTKEVQDRPHPCSAPGCFWRFVNPKDVKRHEETHIRDARPNFPCPDPFCVKSYKRGDNLNRHLRNEHGDDSGLGSSRSSSTYSGLALRRA